MKNIITTFALFLFFSTIYSNDLDYALTKNQKMVGTFSGDIDQQSSIHIIILKNKINKNFEIIPYYIDQGGNSTQLDMLSFKKEPGIISYHLVNNNLVLFVKQKIKKAVSIEIIDLDLKTKKSKKTIINDYDHTNNIVFRQKEKTLFLKFDDDKLALKEIINSDKIFLTETKLTAIENAKITELFSTNPDVINLNEYVKNGSVNNSKAYYENGDIYIESTNNKTAQSNILKFNINSIADFKTIVINNEVNKKTKDSNSYIYNGKLITTSISKEDSQINVTDINSQKQIGKFSLRLDLAKFINLEKIESFIKKSHRKAFSPTITANKTIENNILINIDYVDTRTYNYYHNWWWHHQQFMQWQHQQMINNIHHNIPTSFGPNQDFLYILPLVEAKKTNIQFVLNKDFKIIEKASKETVRKDINKDVYVDQINKNSATKHTTISFLDDTVRTIYYVKKTKKVMLKIEKLDFQFSIKN